jgi:hypothetical protein
MELCINKEGLLERLRAWDGFLRRKVHVVACGGTAMTLLGVKASTRDIDLIVPDTGEYAYLVNILSQTGYAQVTGAGWSRGDGFVFDLFKGNRVHTTELLKSPLEAGRNTRVYEFSRLYLGVLNHYDIIVSKLFRSTAVDVDDCLLLLKQRRDEIDAAVLTQRFKETASFDIAEEKMLTYWDAFAKKAGL